ncbi:hypothetical protein T484DRAFT_1778816, partial [Baffinella frigidus]
VDRIGWIDAYITLALSGETAKTSIKKKQSRLRVDRIGWIDAYITLALSGEAAKISIKKKQDWVVDRIGWIDAYITLALSGETAKTSIKKKQENPAWDEEFSLPISDSTASLQLTLLDW